jgi:predicted secreted protein
MSQRLSKEFVILYAGQVIARCVDFTFEVNKGVIDLTSLDSDSWREILADMKEWRITFNALVARPGTASNSYDAMLDDLKNSDEPVTIAIGARVDGSAIEQGEGILTQLSFAARVGERASYSGTLEGHGELTTTTMPAFEADFLTFSVPNQIGSTEIDKGMKTVMINVGEGYNLSNVIATWTVSPSVTKVIVGTKYQQSGITANDFTRSLIFRVYAGNQSMVNEYAVLISEVQED